MVDRAAAPIRPRRDGFTLIEVLIVVSMVAIVTTVLAATVTVVIKSAPPAEVRTDDARSVQGLVTWLPQDIDAAPPGGFNRDHAYWPCGGSAPADSYNIITAEWSESGALEQRFVASYRYDLTGDGWHMARYSCVASGAGPMGAAERINLTSELPAWNASSPPARVSMCRSAVTAGATCPVSDIIPDSDLAPSEVHSMKLFIQRLDGVVATIDAAPKNPDQSLADDPNASPNLRPELAAVNVTLPMFAGETTTIDVVSTHGAGDPEGDPISVALDSTEPLPTGIVAVASDPTFVTVTADPALTPGTLSPAIVMIVSDNHGGWIDALLTIEILPEPNVAPVATASNYVLQMQAGQTVVVPIGSTHGVSDPNGDPLTVAVLTYPSGLTTPPKTNMPGPLDLEVKTPGSALLGLWPDAIALEVSDGRGGVIPLTISIEIVAATPNSGPVASPTDVPLQLHAGDSLSLSLDTSHGVSDPDGDPLAISAVSAPAGVVVTLDGGLSVTVATDLALLVGPLASPVELRVKDIHGAEVVVTISITIVETPPPPSDCVLGSLVANPGSVDRQGGGPNAHLLKQDVVVTVTYSGTCDGLTLSYDTGDTSGLGVGTGRVFPPGSPSSVVIVGKNNGGTEKWAPGSHVLTATTTSAVTPSSISTSLTVN